LGLPDLSGQQVIRHMQDDARWRDIPVVIVTGQDGPETVSPMRGHMTVSKAGGLVPGETIHWIQGVIDTATHKTPSAA
jgi:CheY-like chemotaxis protein